MGGVAAHGTLLPGGGGGDGGGHDRAHGGGRPALPGDVRSDGADAVDSGTAAAARGAAPALLFLGERPWRVFHGLGAAGRLLRGGAVATSARAAAEGREDAVGGEVAGYSCERAQSELLQRDPRHVRLPAQRAAANAKGMARAGALAAQLVQRPAGGRGGGRRLDRNKGR